MEIKSTYIENLDEVLGGGMIRPSTTLIAGTAGTGRTTLGLQSLCMAARNNEKVLYVAITPKSKQNVKEMLSRFKFFEDTVNVHVFDTSMAERDPLTMLVELGNVVTSMGPDRVMIDPITPLGYSFPDSERRRFMYSLSSAIGEWNCIVYLTGTLLLDEIHTSVINDIVDNILYLSQTTTRFRTMRNLEILKMSGLGFTEGEHTFEIKDSGVKLYPICIPEKISLKPERERLKSSIEKLDTILAGGILKGSSILVAGSAGTGKTIFGLHFIMDGAINGEPGLIISFEETPEELYQYSKSFGWDLEKMEKEDQVRILFTPPSDVYPNKHTLHINKLIEEIGVQRVFVDDISGFDYAFERNIDKKEHIYNLIRNFKNKKITSCFTSEIENITGNLQVSHIALSMVMDVVILLRYVEIESEMKKALLVLKIRGSGHDKSLREYSITDSGMKIGKQFREYTGILTGSATPAHGRAYEPYTSGFTSEKDRVMRELIKEKETTAERLSETTGIDHDELEVILSQLEGLGYVVPVSKKGEQYYKIVLTDIEKE
ncbi:putative circadian clock protein, KaiC [Methanosalsum zhilinae DSM 4017]|uniref:non-specific serine/threonine protein kinase n=1 Tax=Methanosalsum zhilinae (strain DSM 4017 / NBRC 107636 / OCM 62 / WeN5) TaxID=679901 RepID=F7XNP2_METZD|nr:ATPase domain-containing protein [Methanosalsum zhilinae]AEH60146.1 putative circadian clock protein, KaiC [Methanosalsum zhilinae DSM 4017]